MKAIVCELCGANELIKTDGLFVCQYCGTKYTLEEAKKLLVTGTVKVDESDKVNEIVKSARRYLLEEDYEKAKEQAQKALDLDPNNVDAYFVSMLASDKIDEPTLDVDFAVSDHLAWLVREKYGIGSKECYEQAEIIFNEMVEYYTPLRKRLEEQSRGFFASGTMKQLHSAFVRTMIARLLFFVAGIEKETSLDNAPQSYIEVVGSTFNTFATYPFDTFCNIALKDLQPFIAGVGRKYRGLIQE